MIQLRVFGSLSIESDSGADASALLEQPKLIGFLLYLVLARPRGFHQRDSLAALFWPELDQEHARASLRKALQRLRQAVGEQVVISRGTDLLGVAPEKVQCDAISFRDAIDDKALRAALDLYAGELLPGFYITGAGDFDEWLEQERTHYREHAVNAAWRLVERFAADSELTNASQLARLVARLASTDERMLRRVLTMLARLGDRAGAIEVYTKFRNRLWRDYETRPSLETQRLVESIQTNVAI
jgi:serine/threonine-protein kinase